MSREELIQEYLAEIAFLKKEMDEILLESGIWTERKRLAFWTNLNRITELQERISALRN